MSGATLTLGMGPHSFDPPHIKAHSHCILHRAEVEASTLCQRHGQQHYGVTAIDSAQQLGRSAARGLRIAATTTSVSMTILREPV